MLKKIIAIFLSLTFLASTVMLHSVLQNPLPATAAPNVQTVALTAGHYIMLPYSYASHTQGSYSYLGLTGGTYQIGTNATGNFITFEGLIAAGSTNWGNLHIKVPTHFQCTSGTGTSTDPFVGLGL